MSSAANTDTDSSTTTTTENLLSIIKSGGTGMDETVSNIITNVVNAAGYVGATNSEMINLSVQMKYGTVADHFVAFVKLMGFAVKQQLNNLKDFLKDYKTVSLIVFCAITSLYNTVFFYCLRNCNIYYCNSIFFILTFIIAYILVGMVVRMVEKWIRVSLDMLESIQ
jgi:hypothetical protein